MTSFKSLESNISKQKLTQFPISHIFHKIYDIFFSYFAFVNVNCVYVKTNKSFQVNRYETILLHFSNKILSYF